MIRNSLAAIGVLLASLATASSIGQEPPGDQPDDALPAGAIATLGVPRPHAAGHTPSMAFSRDGKRLACGGLLPHPNKRWPDRYTIQIVDGHTGKPICELAGHMAPILALQFSPSGDLLVSMADDNTVNLWSLDEGYCRWTVFLSSPRCASFSHDEKHVFVTNGGDRVWVVETASAKTLWTVDVEGRREPGGARRSPLVDDPQAPGKIYGLKNTEVIETPFSRSLRPKVYDGTGQPTVYYHTTAQRMGGARIRFLSDGKTMVSISPEGRIRYRDVLTGEEQSDRGAPEPLVLLRGRRGSSKRSVSDVLWPSSETQSICLSPGEVVATVDGPSGKRLNTIFDGSPPVSWITGHDPFPATPELLEQHRGEPVARGQMPWMSDSIAVSPDGRLAALMGRRKANEFEVRMVGLPGGEVRSELLLHARVKERDFHSPAKTEHSMRPKLKPVFAAFSPDGNRLAVEDRGRIRMLDVQTGEDISAGDESEPPAGMTADEHQGRVDAVVFSPDGSLVATAGQDYSTRLWSTRTGKLLGQWLHDWRFGTEHSVAFSPDGAILAVDVGGHVDLVRCSDGQVLHQLRDPKSSQGRGPSSWPSAVAFSPDGGRLAVSRFDYRSLTWWDVQSGVKIEEIALEVSERDKPLFSRTFVDGAKSEPVVFSPSLKWLGATHFQYTVYLHWDTRTGRRAFKTASQPGFTSVCLSPDDRLLALGAPEEPIRIVDTATGDVVRRLTGPDGLAYPRAFLEDGRVLVSDHDDGTRFWDVASGQSVFLLPEHRVRACSENGRYAATVSETALEAWRNDPMVVASTILIWDLRRLTTSGSTR
ncbi:MAG: WD40 repeat domain-containing protein [Planctomycetota bacterium]|jgi:WD40 repeat protein